MATINFVVPKLEARTYTGGIYCIARYAMGLRAQGHEVNFLPLLPSLRPEWIPGDFGWMPAGAARDTARDVWRELARMLRVPGVTRPANLTTRDIKQRLTSALGFRYPRLLTPLMQKALQCEYIATHIKPADATIATSYKTALAVHLYGTGKKFYFAQHYEPYFAEDAPDPLLAEQEAKLSYRFGLRTIANSTWLKHKLESTAGQRDIPVCPNAIDHSIFNGVPAAAANKNELRIISYGGRKATWKGFKDMAEGMRLARQRLPDFRLRWLVYGSSLLPPDNTVASYESLGFLQLPALADAYRSADFLLSASWYESFPLFPIEAMACGLPVITTQAGTEDYAVADETAMVVSAQDAASIADAIVYLVTHPQERHALAVRGQTKSLQFTWDNSVKCLTELLLV
jgi:glycosyltransferase involved in cell wall biosynthesis